MWNITQSFSSDYDVSVILSVTTKECLSQLINVSHTLGSDPNISDTKPISTRQSLMNQCSQMTFSTLLLTVHVENGIRVSIFLPSWNLIFPRFLVKISVNFLLVVT